MSYTSREYKDIEVGETKCVIWYPGFGRNHKGTYSRPLTVTRVTKTLFQLEPESDSAKPKRFALDGGKEYGHKYGVRACRARVATPEMLKEVDEYNKEMAEQERQKQSEERQAEIAMREKYKVLTVTDDSLQDKYLKPLREACESGERKINDFMRNFNGVSVENDNFYRVRDAVEREMRSNEMQTGVTMREKALDLHNEVAKLIIDYAQGKRFTVDGVEVTDIDDLCRATITEKLRREYDTFFNARFSSRDITEGDQRFITVLRGILGHEYEYAPVRPIKEGEEQ